MLVYQEFWMTGDNNGAQAGSFSWPLDHKVSVQKGSQYDTPATAGHGKVTLQFLLTLRAFRSMYVRMYVCTYVCMYVRLLDTYHISIHPDSQPASHPPIHPSIHPSIHPCLHACMCRHTYMLDMFALCVLYVTHMVSTYLTCMLQMTSLYRSL